MKKNFAKILSLSEGQNVSLKKINWALYNGGYCMKTLMKIQARFLAFVAPLVTGLCVAALPAKAASLVFSESAIQFDRFSHIPYGIETFAYSNTVAIAGPNSSTAAFSAADSLFLVKPTLALNYSVSTAMNQGNSYFALGSSKAQIIGNFLIEPEESFSFNFRSSLHLSASTDNPKTELAGATGNIAFFLFGNATNAHPCLLDIFSVSSHVSLPKSKNFVALNKSSHIRLNEVSKYTRSNRNKSLAMAELQGRVQRNFREKTYLSLVAVNETNVAIPEPSTSIALPLFAFVLCVGCKGRIKRSQGKKK